MPENDAMLLESEPRAALYPRLVALARRRTRAYGLVTTIAVMALVALGVLAPFIVPARWDVEATRVLQSIEVPGLKSFMHAVSGFGNVPKFAALTGLALLACDRRNEALWLTWSGLGGWFLSMQLKPLLAHPRPTADEVAVFHEWSNASFPSGHVVFYVCFFGFLFFVARERMRRGSLVRTAVLVVTALIIALVGVSRVYLGEHWPSDIPGSYLLGGLWLALSLKLYHRFEKRIVNHLA